LLLTCYRLRILNFKAWIMRYRKSVMLVVAFMLLLITVFAIEKLTDNKGQQRVMLVFPEMEKYEEKWAEVDSLMINGLSKSALEEVQGLYEVVLKEDNYEQIIKTTLYLINLRKSMEEKALVKIIGELEQKIPDCKYPAKPVLQSITAELYWTYYTNNRWKFYNRSETVGFDNDDLSTWDLKKIVAKVLEHYEASLENKHDLQRTSIGAMEEVLIRNRSASWLYRPTLYDFLAHRAVDFMMNEEPSITRPADQFSISDPKYLGHYREFCNEVSIQSMDTFSMKFHALKILQELVALHIDDTVKAALVDVDLKRLQFVHRSAKFEGKDSLYISALSEMRKEFKGDTAWAEPSYQLAKFYNGQSYKFERLNPGKYKWNNKMAVDICNEVVEGYQQSFASKNCKHLKWNITRKQLSFEVERVNVPNKPFRALVSSKNINKLYFRAIKIGPKKYEELSSKFSREKLFEKLMDYKISESWEQEIEDDGDYHSHSVEIKMPSLSIGHYVILASGSKDFDGDEDGISLGKTWVSSISYIDRRLGNGKGIDIYVLNRENGHPMADVSVQLWYHEYDYKSRVYKYQKGGKFTSNREGYFKIPASKDYRNFKLEFVKDDDRLFSDKGFYTSRYYKNNKPQLITHFYTDRGIYRPGQTVYFKGIVLNKQGDKYSIKSRYNTTTVTFYDVNYQKISDLTLTTNDYGTVAGSFTVPVGVLNGRMRISNAHGTKYIQVEEYKRPKFEVKFDTIRNEFRLGDSVMAQGYAKAYAGFNIDNATVKYRVVRSASFPWWWYYRGGGYSNTTTEILNGTVTTDADGKFVIPFKAIPSGEIAKSDNPTYNFNVYADVTDINGETHSAQQSVFVSYKALKLNIAVLPNINQGSKEEIGITCSNMSGNPIPSTVNVSVIKLKDPERIFRKRFWQKPDRFSMSRQEYYEHFPVDVYNNENSVHEMERGKNVLAKKVETQKQSSIELGNIGRWAIGNYLIEASTKDKYGEVVKEIQFFTVYNEKNNSRVPGNEVSWYHGVKIEGEPGGIVPGFY